MERAKLTDFAVYRNRLVVTLRFMEALVDLQHSNPKSITSLFRDSKDELDKVFTELSLCNKSDPQVEDIIQEFQSRNFVKCTPEVKVEKAEPSDPEEDSTMYDVPYDDICDVVCQMKSESDDSSSDDDKPLVKRKPPKSKSPRISSKSTPTTGKKKPGRPRIHPEGKMLEAPWSCDKCKFKTKYRMAVDRHKAVHEKRENRTYPCTICEMVFKTKDEWRNHSMNHPENQIVCEVCGAALKNPNSYKSHMERHEEKRKYQCEYCEYASHTLLALKAHMNVHKTDNGKKRCEICSAVFKTGSLLKRHMEGHSNERKYHCEACPARFNTNNALRNHRNRVHLAIRHPCDYCDKTFDQKIILRDHIERKVHEKRENRIFPCEICGMAFKTKVEMRKHGSTHPENQFICEMCGSTLKSPESLRIHMERHSNVTQKLTCEYCPYTTPHFQNMKSHMNTHSSTAESFKKECEVCKATFRSTHLLNRHMETHGEERKYACTECPARFKTRNALRGHRNCVHLVIRYPCEYCEKRFDQKLTLRDHTERVHNIQANFPCDICLLTVYSQEKLDLHRLRHENPKPLECGVCLTIHPSQEAFDAHLCISYREDYFCCARDYRNYAQLNRHMWAKHGIKTNFRVKPIPGVLVGQLRRTRKRLIRCRKCDITFPTKALKLQHLIECNSGTQNNDETYRYDA
ncbi:AAEL011509-PA [Aedes aegypti]|uniref:AAEL011509-PA n=1 Tax=Aedes aegypti TaxID=7159 RepID=Q16PV0_AEDAE|nr:AAEL011509-PA [Aedes aegypti]